MPPYRPNLGIGMGGRPEGGPESLGAGKHEAISLAPIPDSGRRMRIGSGRSGACRGAVSACSRRESQSGRRFSAAPRHDAAVGRFSASPGAGSASGLSASGLGLSAASGSRSGVCAKPGQRAGWVSGVIRRFCTAVARRVFRARARWRIFRWRQRWWRAIRSPEGLPDVSGDPRGCRKGRLGDQGRGRT